MRLRVALPLDGELAHVVRRNDGYIERRGRRRAAFRVCQRYDLFSDLERTDVRRPARYGAAAAVRVCRVYRHAVRIDDIALDKDRRIGNDLDGAEPVSAARRERDEHERRGHAALARYGYVHIAFFRLLHLFRRVDRICYRVVEQRIYMVGVHRGYSRPVRHAHELYSVLFALHARIREYNVERVVARAVARVIALDGAFELFQFVARIARFAELAYAVFEVVAHYVDTVYLVLAYLEALALAPEPQLHYRLFVL